MFEYERREHLNVSPQAAWRAWSDIDSWGEWTGHISDASLEGPLQEGAKGHLVTGGRKVPFRVIDVADGRHFTNESKLPLARLRAHHEVHPGPDPDSCEVVNRVTITGLLSPVFGKVIGKDIDEEHGGMLRNLEQRARSHGS